MQTIDRRLTALEAAAAPGQHIAQARATGDMSNLSDAELERLIAELSAEIGPEQTACIMAMSDAELAGIAEGNV